MIKLNRITTEQDRVHREIETPYIGKTDFLLKTRVQCANQNPGNPKRARHARTHRRAQNQNEENIVQKYSIYCKSVIVPEDFQ